MKLWENFGAAPGGGVEHKKIVFINIVDNVNSPL